MTPILFTQHDLELFSAASRDRNPLHLSTDYARKSPFGEPVVFGILGGVVALSSLRERPHRVLSRLAVEFRHPIYTGINYAVETREESQDQASVKLFESGRLVLQATFSFRPGSGSAMATSTSQLEYPSVPSDAAPQDLVQGVKVVGSYAPREPHFSALTERLGLSSRGIAPIQAASLMWCSFLVGMRLPGSRSIFWKLEIEFDEAIPSFNSPLEYEATVERFDDRMNVLIAAAAIHCGQQPLATARIWSFVRHDSPLVSVESLESYLPRSNQLQGALALVIGGSRGLGSAISLGLALQGCTVLVNFQKCQAEARTLSDSLNGVSGRMSLVQGDAASIEWCRELRSQILTNYGGLDILVCNACPPIRPLGFSLESIERFQNFVSASLSLVSVPMASFLEVLSERSGCNVVISSSVISSAVSKAYPREWPHYVTSKYAVEGLVRWAATQYNGVRFLVPRPPKLLTDQMNTPLGRQGAIAVERAASVIVSRLCQPAPAGTVEFLESF